MYGGDLARIIKYIKINALADDVLSYADMSVGHNGTIYKAANFELIGSTSPTKHVFWNGIRYHPRSLTIDRPYSYRLRDAIKCGEATIETLQPKGVFLYKITNRNIKS